MTEREAFIRAIAADLYDDTPRLAFADWLDEHGEHDRAEFIRVQIELEPIRDKYEIPRATELHEREEHFGSRRAYQHDSAWAWLRDMPENWNDGASIEFRRGFPDVLALSARNFLEMGSTIRKSHPTIRRVIVHCLNGWGKRLAACENLRGLAELELACWYSDDDMKAIATSLHLAELQVLVLWMGRNVEGTTDAKLCQITAKTRAWPKLRELILLDPEGTNEKQIKRRVTAVNKVAGRKIARYERGYPELFPLNARFCYDWPVVGRLPDGRAAVLVRSNIPGALVIRTFDTSGGPTDEELHVPLPRELAIAVDADNWDGKYTQVARDVLGFEPGFVHVKEGALGDHLGPWRGHDNDWNRCGLADDSENPTDYNDNPHPNGIGGEIYWVLRGGEFEVGSSGWADKTGHVHST